jgi:hypothetical protein
MVAPKRKAPAMTEHRSRRFQVVAEEDPPHGDLYELEQTTTYRVVDTRTGQTVMTFRGEMRASLSRTTGMWDDYGYSGVREIAIAPDGESVVVTDWDGHTESVPLPR